MATPRTTNEFITLLRTNSTAEAAVEAAKAAQSALDAEAQVALAAGQVVLASEQVSLAAGQVSLAAGQVTLATGQVTLAQLEAWKAEAERMTANSYATEAVDTVVKIYSSNEDGTFTATPTAEYSALHWKEKAALEAASVLTLDAGEGIANVTFTSEGTTTVEGLQRYIRVGNIVKVSGRIIVTPVNASLCRVYLELPIATSITSATDIQGGATSYPDAVGPEGIQVTGYATENEVQINIAPYDLTLRKYDYFYTYSV